MAQKQQEERAPETLAQAKPIKTLRHEPWEIALLWRQRTVQIVLLTLASLIFALYFLHLSADFPNHSPWMDWAKYTDEGWYGDAAIRHFDLGHWYVRGDFNPAAALPVWPFLEGVVFRFTGVGIVPARALTVGVFGLTLLCAYGFLLRALPARSPKLAPAGAVLLLAASPFCYAFMRMAILEPLLVLLTLLSLLVASTVAPYAPTRARRVLPPLVLGLLLPLMILTKTTAIFLLPSVAWMLAARCGFRPPLLLRWGGLAAATGLTLWLLYFGLFVRPRFLEDYRYLFSANAYTGITLATAVEVLTNTVRDGRWMGPLLFPLALLAGAATPLWPRLRSNAAAMSLLLWAGGYGCFLAYHNNLQPRYYLVVAVPLTLLLALVLELAWTRDPLAAPPGRPWRGSLWQGSRIAAAAVAGLLVVVAAVEARETLSYIRRPEYTFLSAAHRIRDLIVADRTHSRLLLSISGSDLSLMTGLPSICDDFGTLELEDRVALYKPGWYVSWNQVDDDKMDALTPRYHLERIAAFPALDDPERNLLILYRLDPAKGYHPPVRQRRRPLPRSLISRLGQQPSESQLQH